MIVKALKVVSISIFSQQIKSQIELNNCRSNLKLSFSICRYQKFFSFSIIRYQKFFSFSICRYQKFLWDLMEKPDTSIAAKVCNYLSYKGSGSESQIESAESHKTIAPNPPMPM